MTDYQYTRGYGGITLTTTQRDQLSALLAQQQTLYVQNKATPALAV